MTTSKKTHYLKGFEGHIENCIGVTQMPLGLVKKLQINGLNANGIYDIPLSTTEGALVHHTVEEQKQLQKVEVYK